MPNERLRAALFHKGLTVNSLADRIGVDPKTVERWITKDRQPYRRTRVAVAKHLDVEETYLWPEALTTEQVFSASGSEIVTIYPHRWGVPRDAWGRLFAEAQREIGILVYSGLFLAEDSGAQRILADKARAGVRVRILLGDPDSPQVAQRGKDEGIGESMAAKIRNVIVYYRPLLSFETVEIRLHSTVLYNSIYTADDQMFVNTHVYGVSASNAPFWHLRKIPGGEIVNTYLESFERVWQGAKPLPAED
ncbi:XRE family transcriptional regulator [Actinomadura parmotrematis]|uniref:XRE family transcriptional regulator n=1 Tax=Actinomadura parmotrematis TaxID=2864039 RepID=A0ABS7FRA4_9ACTN|nr:XRE family transcriptional regulator [Actinomadura parmotrematis]MBW8482259.1 XRE family transcriptional regulator [Actinomadura parmotrematis]